MVQSVAPGSFFANEEIFKHLINSVEDYAIFVLDINGHIMTWNKGAEKIKGYQAAEVIGKHISIFYSADDIKKREPMQNLNFAAVHGHFEKEGWRVRKDGSRFWANIVFTALHDEQGELKGFAKVTRDMTEIKKAQQELELLTRQIDLSHDAIYTMGTNKKIKNWNHGAQKLYGFTKGEAIGKDSNDLLKTVLFKEEIDKAFNAVENENYWTGELNRKTKNGSDMYVHASTTTIRDNNSVITGYVTVSFDITEEKKLREQVTHLATIIEHSSEAIISRGMDRRVISWNKGAEELFGYSKEEAIGKTVPELRFTSLTIEEVLDMERQVIQSGIWKKEMKYFHKNRSSFFGAVTANGIRNERGETTIIIFIIRDISKHKQLEDELKNLNDELEEKVLARTAEVSKNEKQFRALIENNNDIISLMDESFRVVYRSPSATRITGWTNDEIKGTEIAQKIIHPDDAKKMSNAFIETMTNPGKHVNVFFRSLHKGGHYLWIEGIVINMLHDENIKSIVFNYRDVTERVNAEEEILKTSQQLRELTAHLLSIREEERASVAREIHDELGQQLTGLKMDMSSLTSRLSSSDNIVIEKIQSIQQLLNSSIKTVRRIATELRPSILDDLGLIAAIEWQCEEFGKRAEIKTRFFSDLENMIFNSGVSTCLFRICQESLTNIARYAAASNVKISLHRIDEKIVLKISDDGIGFDTAMKGNKKTWGLVGMKERAAMMGGSLAIESKLQKGTTVEVNIPLSANT